MWPARPAAAAINQSDAHEMTDAQTSLGRIAPRLEGSVRGRDITAEQVLARENDSLVAWPRQGRPSFGAVRKRVSPNFGQLP